MDKMQQLHTSLSNKNIYSKAEGTPKKWHHPSASNLEFREKLTSLVSAVQIYFAKIEGKSYRPPPTVE